MTWLPHITAAAAATTTPCTSASALPLSLFMVVMVTAFWLRHGLWGKRYYHSSQEVFSLMIHEKSIQFGPGRHLVVGSQASTLQGSELMLVF